MMIKSFPSKRQMLPLNLWRVFSKVLSFCEINSKTGSLQFQDFTKVSFKLIKFFAFKMCQNSCRSYKGGWTLFLLLCGWKRLDFPSFLLIGNQVYPPIDKNIHLMHYLQHETMWRYRRNVNNVTLSKKRITRTSILVT